MSTMTVADLQDSLHRINPRAKVTLITPYGYPIFLEGVSTTHDPGGSDATAGSLILFGKVEATPKSPEWTETTREPNALWRRLNKKLNGFGDENTEEDIRRRPALMLTLVSDDGVHQHPEEA